MTGETTSSVGEGSKPEEKAAEVMEETSKEAEQVSEEAQKIAARVPSDIVERLERLEREIAELRSSLANESEEASRISGEEESSFSPLQLITPRLGVDIDKLMKYVKDVDDPLKPIVSLAAITMLQQNILLNNLIIYDQYERLMARRKKLDSEADTSTVMAAVDKIAKAVESKTGAPISMSDYMALFKEVMNFVKEIKGAAPTIDEKELVEKVTAAVSAKLERSGMGPKDALSVVKETLDTFKSLVATYRELFPVQQQVATSTSASPLAYQGAAPWWFHPDAKYGMQMIMEFVKGVGDTIANIVKAIKAPALASLPSYASQQKQQASLPEELALG
jgi:hypothetical protein